MKRFAAALFVFLSLGPLNAQQPSAADTRIAAGISQTEADFQARLNRLAVSASGNKAPPGKGGSGRYGASRTAPNPTEALPAYPAGDLNSILAGTRQQLLDILPPDAAPLRAYVMQNFPKSVAGVPSGKLIDMRTCGPYINAANDLLTSLKSVNAYRVDLVLDSNPTGALFELAPVAGDKLARASRGTLTNVWRGVYHYTVVKDGEKTINGTVNLVREKGNLLRCTFVHASSPGAALPCELLAAQ